MLPFSSILVVYTALIVPIVLTVYVLSKILARFISTRWLSALTVAICIFYLFAGLRTSILELDTVVSKLNILGEPASLWAKLAYFVPVIVLAALFAFLLRRYLRIYTVALCVMTLTAALPIVYTSVIDANDSSFSNKRENSSWQSASLANKPNIYFILVDGYGSLAHLEEMGVEVSPFRNWLIDNDFSVYEDAFSNYQPTTAAMPAIFEMQHHYYSSTTKFSEISRAGRIVTGGNNSLMDFFRKEGYSIEYIHEGEYLLLHGCFADYCFPSTSFAGAKTVLTLVLPGFLRPKLSWSRTDTDYVISQALDLATDSVSPHFQYIHLYQPMHGSSSTTCDERAESEQYEERVRKTNQNMKTLIEGLISEDPGSLIILGADHGPMITNNCSFEHQIDTPYEYRDRAGVLLAVRWSANAAAMDKYQLKTTINLFKYVIASLAKDEKTILSTLEPEDVYVRGSESQILKIVEEGEFLQPSRIIQSRTEQ